jgi:glycine dehydrogenase subunit 2
MSWPLRTSLSIENSKDGHKGYSLKRCDVPSPSSIPDKLKRKKTVRLPELSELGVVRHYTRLSQLNYSIDGGMYPLGSCTMKYNPRINEYTSSHPNFLRLHPRTPDELAQGALEAIFTLEKLLSEISGFKRVSLQPAAGAQGEYLGVRMIRAYHEERGQNFKKILIPESAHGTNCATATLCGYEVVPVPATDKGILSIHDIDELSKNGDIAALMVTNPNTVGIFESEIKAITDLLHSRGALVYCDGANMNALLGVARPGDLGIDVMHFNQHKTFTTPHGGGGPGCGAVGVAASLEAYLPNPTIEKDNNGKFFTDFSRAKSVGRIKDYNGHFLMMLRSLTYILELGSEGLHKVGRDAILLANYIRVRLKPYYDIAYDRACMHEVIFTDKKQKKFGVKTLDIAKRLIDLGYHPPTVYFPLIVDGALMIEPTETESLDSVEDFCTKMIQISKEAEEDNAFAKHFEGAPKQMPYSRINETKAARDLVLTWRDIL